MTDRRPPSFPSLRVGREVTDAPARPLLAIAAGLALLIAVSTTIIIALPKASSGPNREESEAARARVDHWVQTGRFLRERRREAAGRLGRLGWLDPDHTTARIPIEDAMRMIVERYSSMDPNAEPTP